VHLAMFDIDGTLVQSNDFDDELFLRAVSEVLGVTATPNWEQYRHVTDAGILDEIIGHHGGSVDRAQAHCGVRTRYIELTRQLLESDDFVLMEVDGAVSFLRLLQAEENIGISIATGGWAETAAMKLAAVGIDVDGMAFASSSDANSRIRIMELSEKRANSEVGFSRRTYFGDGVWDQVAADDLSHDFIAVGNNVEHHLQIDDFSQPEKVFELLGL